MVHRNKSYHPISLALSSLPPLTLQAINGAPAAYSGANYHSAIQEFVNLLNSNGIVVILELHWSAAGSAMATGQVLNMRDRPDKDFLAR